MDGEELKEFEEERKIAIDKLMAALDEAERAVKGPEGWLTHEEVMKKLKL